MRTVPTENTIITDDLIYKSDAHTSENESQLDIIREKKKIVKMTRK